MSTREQTQRAIIILSGVLTTALALLTVNPAPTRADENCLEPYLGHCISKASNCVSCTQWCRVNVGENCVEEDALCEADDSLCTGSNKIREECMCKPDGPILPGG